MSSPAQREMEQFVNYSAGYFLTAYRYFLSNGLNEERSAQFAETLTGLMFSASIVKTNAVVNQANIADLLLMAHPKGDS